MSSSPGCAGWSSDGPGDPRLGAIGGSYGGGYQFLAAFEQLRRKGKPVFDALAPEITWHDLNRSLAPEGVVRTEWALALSAAVAADRRAAAERLQGARRGRRDRLLARRLDPRHGGHADVLREERSEVPRLPGPTPRDPGAARPGHHRHAVQPPAGPGQLAQGADTRKARRHSIFVGYNGGHVLPAVYPRASTSPPTRAARSSPAATSPGSRCASWTRTSRAATPA